MSYWLRRTWLESFYHWFWRSQTKRSKFIFIKDWFPWGHSSLKITRNYRLVQNLQNLWRKITQYHRFRLKNFHQRRNFINHLWHSHLIYEAQKRKRDLIRCQKRRIQSLISIKFLIIKFKETYIFDFRIKWLNQYFPSFYQYKGYKIILIIWKVIKIH